MPPKKKSESAAAKKDENSDERDLEKDNELKDEYVSFLFFKNFSSFGS